MNLNERNFLELAKQGNTKAIEALINRSLQPKGIMVKVNLSNSCLQIIVESSKSLNQKLITDFLLGGIRKLNIESIENIRIFSKQSGQDFPDWIQDTAIRNKEESVKIQESGSVSSFREIDKSLSSSNLGHVKSKSLKSNDIKNSTGDQLEEGIWSKSKAFTISAITSAWKWYISGFKKRPDLPLFLSPRLYRILLTLLIFSWITAPFRSSQKPVISTSNNYSLSNLEPGCDPAGGNIWTGIRLYRDTQCASPFATIVGGGKLKSGESGVLIQFDSGALEWKSRSAVRDQAYVKTNDPAHNQKLWREIDQ